MLALLALLALLAVARPAIARAADMAGTSRVAAGEATADLATSATRANAGRVGTQAVFVAGKRRSRVAKREAAQVHVVTGATLRNESRDLADALDQVPGLRVMRVGGYGAAVQVQVRGATPAQSLVALGDIPLRSTTGRPVDLEAVPLVALRGVEVWHSRAPGSMGATPIGGVIRLRPRRPGAGAAMRSAVGSFGAGLLEGRGAWGDRAGGGSANVRLVTGDGDFPYRHNSGTPLDPTDDQTRRRGNNAVRRISGLLEEKVRFGRRWRLGMTWLGGWRQQGLPGLAVAEASVARLTAHQHDAVVRATAKGHGHAEELWVRGGLERLDVDDHLGELGPVQHRTQRVRAGEVGARWRWNRGDVRPRIAISGRGGGISTTDKLTQKTSPESTQTAATISAGADLRHGMWRLAPTVRAELIGSQRYEDPTWVARWQDVRVPTRSLFSGEFGAVATLARGFEATASAALANRAPTLIELFGNDGTVRPAPRLRDERAATLTAGLRLRRGDALLHGVIMASAFWSVRTNLIQLVRAGPGQAVHTNIGRASVAGAELSGHAGWGTHLAVDAGWAWLRGRDVGTSPTYGGNALPLRPAGRWHIGLAWRGVQLRKRLRAGTRFTARWQAGTFADRANLVVIPSRTQLDGSVYMTFGAWRVAMRIDNALNAARFDRVGLPLPGRTWMLTVAWQVGAGS